MPFRNALYYIKAFLREFIPNNLYYLKVNKILSHINSINENVIIERVNYYNKLSEETSLSNHAVYIKDFKIPSKGKVYYFDLAEYLKYFEQNLKFILVAGDNTKVPFEPSIVKSRPINEFNQNTILLKLNKIRHFQFIKDKFPFENKLDKLIARGVVKVPHRIEFYKKYFDHPLCNLGQINSDKNHQWIKPKISRSEHLRYKFILCLEGYDVATNLKWVMSSNSIAVMTKPKFETWFMEGKLIGDFHYIEIKDDYSDLEEKLTYYMNNPDRCLTIIENANAFTNQFKDKRLEDLISILVLQKYFVITNQNPKTFNIL